MDWWNRQKRIQILVDNDSWILPWAGQLREQINRSGNFCDIRRHADDIEPGEVVFLLGCTRLVPSRVLARNRRNLVVHESDLPQGRGFAPMNWQILAGAMTIPVCLLKAHESAADAGEVFLKHEIRLNGTELADELRRKQGQATVDICLEYLSSPTEPLAVAQTGQATTYPRRRPVDSRLNVHGTLAEQFDLMRICDNQRYPAFFEYRGHRYELRIRKLPLNDSLSGQPARLPEAVAGDQGIGQHRYVVAGCKSWNRQVFDQNHRRLPGLWHYVDARQGLDSDWLEKIDPAAIFFLHWSERVETNLLERFRCVCFHMTDLPYGRGGSPLQNLIVRGHRQTMMTALQMTEEMDSGPVFLKRPLSLDGSAAEILRRGTELSFAMIEEIIRNDLQPVPQYGDVVRFVRRKPDESQITECHSPVQLYDHIRMLDGEGYPRAFLDWNRLRIEFANARLSADGQSLDATVNIRPGKIAGQRHAS